MNLGLDWKYFVVDPIGKDVYEFENLLGQAHLAWVNSSKINPQLKLVSIYCGCNSYTITHAVRIYQAESECWGSPVEKDMAWLPLIKGYNK